MDQMEETMSVPGEPAGREQESTGRAKPGKMYQLAADHHTRGASAGTGEGVGAGEQYGRFAHVSVRVRAGVTWTEAFKRASARLDEERRGGTDHRKLYLGASCYDRWYYRHALASPSLCLRVWQYVAGAALVLLGFFGSRALGFHVYSQIAYVMALLNWFVKIPTTGSLYLRDNSIVYALPRMMGQARLTKFLRDSSFASCANGIQVAFSVMTVANLVSYVALGVMRSHVMAVPDQIWFVLMLMTMFLGVPRYVVTFHFIGLGRALAQMIEDFDIIRYRDGTDCGSSSASGDSAARTVDWANAFENYHLLMDTVGAFSKSFAPYFFFAEFVLLIASCCLGVATYMETRLLVITASATGGSLDPEQLFRCLLITCFLIIYLVFAVYIFAVASSITGNARRIAQRAHRLCARVEIENPTSQATAFRFYTHVERASRTAGFKAMGIIISPSLVAKLGYGVVSLLVTGGLFLMRYAERN